MTSEKTWRSEGGTPMSHAAVLRSGRYVGDQLHFQQGYVVFQLELAFFQTPQLQLLMPWIAYQDVDHGIQVAVFDFKLNNATTQFFGCHVFRYIAVEVSVPARRAL
jgi:hypothetical protein